MIIWPPNGVFVGPIPFASIALDVEAFAEALAQDDGEVVFATHPADPYSRALEAWEGGE